MNEEREKLIQELHNIEVKTPCGMRTKRIGSLLKYWHLKAIADWIIKKNLVFGKEYFNAVEERTGIMKSSGFWNDEEI